MQVTEGKAMPKGMQRKRKLGTLGKRLCVPVTTGRGPPSLIYLSYHTGYRPAFPHLSSITCVSPHGGPCSVAGASQGHLGPASRSSWVCPLRLGPALLLC